MPVHKLVQEPESPASQGMPGTAMRAVPMVTDRYEETIQGTIDSVRGEIDDAFADMKSFVNAEPDEIMRVCSGHSARLSELKVRIQRIEDIGYGWKAVRTREIEPALEELERQYAIASRRHSVRELDWRMESGER